MTTGRKLKATAQLAAAGALFFVLAAGAHQQKTLHLFAVAAMGYAAASRIPKPWAPIAGSAAAAACAAFLTGEPLAYGLGHGAVVGMFLWCVVRLSGDAAKNLK